MILIKKYWYWIVIIILSALLIYEYGYKKYFVKNDIEICADIFYTKMSGNRVKPILKENLKTKLNSDWAYREIFANCEELKIKNPETFKQRWQK